MTIAGFIKLLTCMESLLLGIWTVKRDSESRRSQLFAIYMFVVAIQSFVEFELCQAISIDRFFFWKHFDVFTFVGVAVMFHFALEYSGLKAARNRRILVGIYGFLGIVTLTQATLGTAPDATLGLGGYVPLHTPVSQLIYMVDVLIGSAFALCTIFLFVRRLLCAEDKRTKTQSAIMLSCMAVLIVFGTIIETLVMLGMQSPLSLSAVSMFIFINPILAVAVFHYDILDITPEAAAADVLRTMTDGLLLTDAKGFVRYVNSALSQMFGLSSFEIVGKNLRDLPLRSGVSSGETASRMENIPVNQKLTDWEGTIMPAGQKWIPVSLSSSPFVRGRDIVGFIVTLRDVSQRKQIEDIKFSVEKMMRHDLKNALCGILGFSELMRDSDNLTEFQRQTMQIINKSGQMMLSQIEGYLALQRMESGTFKVDSLPVDVMDIVRDVKQNLKGLCESQNVDIEIAMDGICADASASFKFITQPALFFGMLMNLVKNAVEASAPQKPVHIDLSHRDGLVVSIHNSGAIPKEIRHRFFGKFVTAKKKNGTGLGAYSAKLIAKSLGGAIDVVTDDDSGTTVTIVFPNPS